MIQIQKIYPKDIKLCYVSFPLMLEFKKNFSLNNKYYCNVYQLYCKMNSVLPCSINNNFVDIYHNKFGTYYHENILDHICQDLAAAPLKNISFSFYFEDIKMEFYL